MSYWCALTSCEGLTYTSCALEMLQLLPWAGTHVVATWCDAYSLYRCSILCPQSIRSQLSGMAYSTSCLPLVHLSVDHQLCEFVRLMENSYSINGNRCGLVTPFSGMMGYSAAQARLSRMSLNACEWCHPSLRRWSIEICCIKLYLIFSIFSLRIMQFLLNLYEFYILLAYISVSNISKGIRIIFVLLMILNS